MKTGLHVWRCDIEYRSGRGRIRREVDVMAPDGVGVLQALDAFFPHGSNDYRMRGYVVLADRARVLVGVA